MRDDLDNYRGALAWLIDRGRFADASSIAWALMFFRMIRGFVAEGLQWYERIIERPSLPPLAEAQVLVGAGALWYTQGELGRARTRRTRAVALAERVGDGSLLAHADECSDMSNTPVAICRRPASDLRAP